MKTSRTIVLLGLSVAVTGVAMASSQSLNEFPPKLLPVLVQVDSHGKVTEVSPSYELPPQFDRLLRQTVSGLITVPANDHGRPVASQFVMNLALRTSARSDGAYDARFAYVSTSPVPSGAWYWAHIDGHRLALVNRNEALPARYPHAWHGWEHRWAPPPGPLRTTPPTQGASREAVLAPRAPAGRAGI